MGSIQWVYANGCNWITLDRSAQNHIEALWKQNTSAWRSHKKANAVDDRQKLASFGFTTSPTPTESPTTDEIFYSRSEMELIKIREMMTKVEDFVKPVVNSKHEGFMVDTYNFVRYLPVKYYFMQRMEGKKIGKASSVAAKIYWEKNKKYRAGTMVEWARELLSKGELSDHAHGSHSKRWCNKASKDLWLRKYWDICKR
ncbi:hypothetical protein BDF21DRAFT_491366 [Thamnidium elegans]|nr:hypothetical protein BDF21DRAFT_491366 [Thamnidium elegans]